MLPFLRFILCTVAIILTFPPQAETITRIWLTHPVSDASQLMVNWETAAPAPSTVAFGATSDLGESQGSDENTTLDQVGAGKLGDSSGENL